MLSQEFAALAPETRLWAQARTADGWLGFDPGLPQAANTGVFRLRWVFDDQAVQPGQACGRLPLVTGPQPGVCYTMPLGAVPIYAEPSTSAPALAVLNPGDYAAVTATNVGWAAVDLRVGNTGLNVVGWMQDFELNLNGPCEN